MEIRVRAAMAVVENGKILLVPHYQTDLAPVQWTIPGGKVGFGESIYTAAVREFYEETGLETEIIRLLDVSEVLRPERPYHSITVTFLGSVTGGQLRAEADHPYGIKQPRWICPEELSELCYHPEKVVEKALRG